jgi:hypothetical protein
LETSEHSLEKDYEIITSGFTETSDTTENPSQTEKLFLHKSVSRWKPSDEKLKSWIAQLKAAPQFKLGDCVITMIQPNTKRPGRTFYNPEKRRKHAYNDGLSFSAIILLNEGCLPQNEHDEASHICGHGRCINPAHLLWESSSKNFSRNECHHYEVICTHYPKCLYNGAKEFQYIKQQIQVHKALSSRKLKKNKLTK